MKDKVIEYLKSNNIITSKFRVYSIKFEGDIPFDHKCKIYYVHIVGKTRGKCVVIGYKVLPELIRAYIAAHVYNISKELCPKEYRVSVYYHLRKYVNIGTIGDLVIGYL